MAVWRPWGTDEVSIHAPVKGRPETKMATKSFFLSFNPRPREGATKYEILDGVRAGVSIHAPVKGRPRLRL